MQTTNVSEDSPKAVFFAPTTSVVHDIALYLSERSVELFAAKELKDAFFGDYFFYVGAYEFMKTFLETEGRKLPKTLIVITSVSDETDRQNLKQELKELPAVKIVVAKETSLGSENTQKIMDFFLGSPENYLEIDTLQKIAADTAPWIKPLVSTEIVEDEKDVEISPAEMRSEKIEKKEIEETARVDEVAEKVSPSISEELPEKKAEEVTEINLGIRPQASPIETSIEIKTTPLVNTKPRWKLLPTLRLSLLTAALTTLFVFVLFPVVVFVGAGLWGGWHLVSAQKSLACSQRSACGSGRGVAPLEQVNNHFAQAASGFGLSKGSIESAAPQFRLFGQSGLHRQLLQAAEVGEKAAVAGVHALAAASESQKLIQAIADRQKGYTFASGISKIKGDLLLSKNALSTVEADIKTSSFQDFLESSWMVPFTPQIRKSSEKIIEVRDVLQTAEQSLSLLPEIIGLYDKKTYLLVFQNHMELRPTGGFIGSYALATFDEGVLRDFHIEDVYTADGALKGHVDPPLPIREFLGQEHWYMRDSNWDPDFTVTGARLIWFLDKQIDTTVDGVIAVDLYFVQKLLEATGPLTLSDFNNETVSSKNLFLKAHQYAMEDFFPGSTQKKDFLKSVETKLFETLLSEDSSSSLLPVWNGLASAFAEKHLLAYFVNPKLETLAQNYGWAGEIVSPPPCAIGSCIDESVMVVDANVGVNKANYFVKRAISDQVKFADGKLKHTLTITYKNDSPDATGNVGGYYKNYLRAYVPQDATVVSARLNSQPLEISVDQIASTSAVAATFEHERVAIAAYLEVPPQEERILEIEYERDVPQAEAFTYRYFLQKQPGTLADPVSITVEYPSSWQAILISPGGSDVSGASTLVKESQVTYNTTLSRDQMFEVSFQQ